MPNQDYGNLIVVSAPSGAGKTTIVKEILKEYPQIIFSISATTRPKRETEIDGIEYFFLSESECVFPGSLQWPYIHKFIGC